MAAKVKVGVLVVLIVASSAAFAASANTSASIERSASVDVVDDSNGLIALESGSNDIVQQNSTGALNINFAQGDATGVNTASTFTVGNDSSSSYDTDASTYAFNITNQDGQSHSVDLGYSLDDDTQSTTGNIQFNVYNSTGSSLTTASEITDGSINLNSGQTAYVVLVVDTHGLDESNDLTGTLTIDV